MGNLDLATITVIMGFAAGIMTIAMGGAIVVTIDDDVCPFFHDPSFLASPGAPALYVLSLCVPLSVCVPSLYVPASCTPHAPSPRIPSPFSRTPSPSSRIPRSSCV